jgi:hypothetical protein
VALEMHYLILDSSMPEPYGKFIWSTIIGNATPFSSLAEADAARELVRGATGVTELDGKWYVVKEYAT